METEQAAHRCTRENRTFASEISFSRLSGISGAVIWRYYSLPAKKPRLSFFFPPLPFCLSVPP